MRYYVFWNGNQYEIDAENYNHAKSLAQEKLKLNQNQMGLIEIVNANDFDNWKLSN